MDTTDLTLETLGSLLLERVRPWVPQGVLPDRITLASLPVGVTAFPTMEQLAVGRTHNCEQESTVFLPIVLVTPVHIHLPPPRLGEYYEPQRPITPYLIGPLMVLHDGMFGVDLEVWRPTTALENAAALCQFPWIGSLRSADGYWSAQVYHWDGKIVGDLGDSGRGHHVAWAPRQQPVMAQYVWLRRSEAA